MLFEIEPSGINDSYLRLTRNGVACTLAPAGSWNGLLRVYHIVAGGLGGEAPHLIFRCLDVGWDDGRFWWKGRAAPVMANPPMIDLLVERGLLNEREAEVIAFATPAGSGTSPSDEALMLRAALKGCTFAPIYESRPGLLSDRAPRVTGFALRTLDSPEVHILEARDGLPVLDTEARAALRSQ